MFPEERKEGSPRFGKLHFPVGLWINSPKKRLAKMSRRWPSVGSVKSTSSDTASRSSETVELRPPGKSKAARHKRLSNLFHRSGGAGGGTGVGAAGGGGGGRWASEKKLAELAAPVPEELAELCGPRQPPGILKIFGGDISRGANYKSVLATPRSTARQLVREALERYGLAPEEGPPDDYVLCDVVGRAAGPGGAWQAEHLRPVGDAERPLVLQDVWQPKAGCSRRFEIRRRQEVERACEAEDEEPAGAEAQGRRLQKSRSRAASGGPAPPKERADNLSLRRSISDMNLSAKKRRERKTVLSVAGGEAGPPPTAAPAATPAAEEPAAEPGGGGAEEPADGLEQLSQCLIRPPSRHPYFLLLQGYDPQDFVVYVMTRPRHVFGRPERRGPPEKGGGGGVDTFLDAPDILPRHCLVRAGEPALVRPFRGAAVTHNGAPLLRQAPLGPGDLLGLGQHFLLVYKDPRAGPAPPPAWLPRAGPAPGLAGALGCPGCGRSPQERHEAVRAYVESRRAELRFRPQEEEALLREILRLADGGGGGGGAALAPAFLLGLCLEHSARALEPAHFPALLARVAQLVKEAVWEKIKEIGERQPETEPEAGAEAPGAAEVAAELRPLVLWLANATELLNLAQGRVLELERELEPEPEGPGPAAAAALPGDLEACDEALAALDEVIMSTFQQCVYYLTKTFGYLFFFSNASLFNTLMERGGRRPGRAGGAGALRAAGGGWDPPPRVGRDWDPSPEWGAPGPSAQRGGGRDWDLCTAGGRLGPPPRVGGTRPLRTAGGATGTPPRAGADGALRTAGGRLGHPGRLGPLLPPDRTGGHSRTPGPPPPGHLGPSCCRMGGRHPVCLGPSCHRTGQGDTAGRLGPLHPDTWAPPAAGWGGRHPGCLGPSCHRTGQGDTAGRLGPLRLDAWAPSCCSPRWGGHPGHPGPPTERGNLAREGWGGPGRLGPSPAGRPLPTPAPPPPSFLPLSEPDARRKLLVSCGKRPECGGGRMAGEGGGGGRRGGGAAPRPAHPPPPPPQAPPAPSSSGRGPCGSARTWTWCWTGCRAWGWATSPPSSSASSRPPPTCSAPPRAASARPPGPGCAASTRR
ncbi:ras-interacting protein 1 isoform X2 [Rhea pennata]|uniref:ras-interacting protein 1 isoform X2 n=1 Tax=Rhea pennata TaxID=8795 RepID=UPI002E25363A